MLKLSLSITSLNFLLADPPNTTPSKFVAPSAPPKQPHRSPPLSATISMPPNPAFMSSSACFSNDYYAGTGSPPSKLHISRFVTVANYDSIASSPTSTAASSGLSTNSPVGLQLFIDLSSYHVQQLPSLNYSAPRSAACQHQMVIYP